ncbi:MAG: hypothetical protein ACE5JE_08985 [Thermoplasmata archaeon]
MRAHNWRVGNRPTDDERVRTWRVALLTLGLLLSSVIVLPFLDLDAPVAPAGAVEAERAATRCIAVGNNWTSCQSVTR